MLQLDGAITAGLQPETVGRLYRRLADALEGHWLALARPNQLPPTGEWFTWLLLAGRGFGKTRAGAEFVREEVNAGRARRVALVAKDEDDARKVMIEGPSGILAACAFGGNAPTYEPSNRRIVWPNGAIAGVFSADDPDSLRGPEHDLAWSDEIAKWRYAREAWDMLQLGLRIGRPRQVVTTTPRPLPIVREIMSARGTIVVRGSTYENRSNLAPEFFRTVTSRYEGTRLGRQELEGELLEDVPGALWKRDWIDRDRITEAPTRLRRVVVAVDPAVSSQEASDETGIVVAAIGEDDHAYILEDRSAKFTPDGWAKEAIAAYRARLADRVVAEVNQGGDMVEATLRMADPTVSYKAVHASRGKVIRAEPIAALYEQRKVHHVGSFPLLEEQMCAFVSDFDRRRGGSPDRLDALVWALTELMVTNFPGYGILEYCRQEAEKVRSAGVAAAATIKIQAPNNAPSHLCLSDGRVVLVPADGIIDVGTDDAAALGAHGWRVL